MDNQELDLMEAVGASALKTLLGTQDAMASIVARKTSTNNIDQLVERSVGKRKLRQTERINLTVLGILAGLDITGLVRAAFVAAFPTGWQPFNNDAADPGAYEDLVLAGIETEINVCVANGVYDAAVESEKVRKGVGQFLSLRLIPGSDRADPTVFDTECQHMDVRGGLAVPATYWIERKATLIVDDNGSAAGATTAGAPSTVNVSIQAHGDFWTPAYYLQEFQGRRGQADYDAVMALAGDQARKLGLLK